MFCPQPLLELLPAAAGFQPHWRTQPSPAATPSGSSSIVAARLEPPSTRPETAHAWDTAWHDLKKVPPLPRGLLTLIASPVRGGILGLPSYFSAANISLEICMLVCGIFADPSMGHHVAERPVFMAGHYRTRFNFIILKASGPAPKRPSPTHGQKSR